MNTQQDELKPMARLVRWKCQDYRGAQAQIADTEAAAKAAVLKSVARRLSVPPQLIEAYVTKAWEPARTR